MSTSEITGRKAFAFIASAFALIIGVNFYMAFQAVGTFPGLETKNSYVASQKFDADRARQVALGWQVSAQSDGHKLELTILDANGQAVEPTEISATLGRATHVGQDQTPQFRFDGQAHVADAVLEPGNWNLRLVAVAEDGTPFRQRVVFYVRPAG